MSELLTEEKNASSEKEAKRAPDFITRTTANDGSASLTVSSATKPAKDNWDKIAAVAPIISGIFIFLAGGVFSYTYNQQQLKVQEIQTIEKFIPHLTGSEQSKKAAILAINSLADAKLAGKIASLYASQGTVSALQSISKNGTGNERVIAEQALKRTMDNLHAREERLDDIENEYKQAKQELNSGEVINVSDADTPVNLVGMSVSYKTAGDYPLAEQLLKRALMLTEKKHGANSTEAAAIWRKLAALHVARGNRAASEACIKRAEAIEGKGGQPAQVGAESNLHESSAAPATEKEAEASTKADEG